VTLNLLRRSGVTTGIDKEARMRKLTIPALTAIVALLALSALSGSAAAATTIAVGDNFFSPASKTIKRGTRVRFNWTGRRPHNVTKTRGPGGGFASITTRSRGVNFAKKFRRSGVYRMICTIHPSEMRLMLRVR
jgi:plastocyanin